MKRPVLTLFWVFAVTLVCSAQTIFYYPQIADGGGWKTTVFITNPAGAGSGAVSGTITFTNSQGGAFNVAFVDSNGNPVSAGNTIPFQVAGGQTRKFVSTGGGPTTLSGFAVVNANGNITGTAIFSQFNGSTLTGEAGVPAVPAAPRQAIFVDLQSGFNTAVAYANPNPGTANVSLQLLSTEGTPVVAPTPRSLPGGNHQALFIAPGFGPALFPDAPPFAGTMQITSDTPLAVIAIRFAPSGLFTTLPPVQLASLINPALNWLERRQWLNPVTSIARLIHALQFRIG